MSEETTSLTAKIVSAFVSHNSICPEDMADLLKQVHSMLAGMMGGKFEQVEVAVTPAVPIKKSITHDTVFCLICGTGHKTLKRHLRTSHDLDPAAYREMFGLKRDYSLVAPSYSEARSSLATSSGLGQKAKVVEPEPQGASSKPVKEAKEKTTKPLRSHSKAEQTRRKSETPAKAPNDAEGASEAA